MAEELKDLIDKINEEGVKAAEAKAAEIEKEAKERAQAIIENARQEAAEFARAAREKVKRMEEESKASLRQAARDLILTLRKEIDAMLDRLVISHAHKAIGPEELVAIIKKLSDYGREKNEITVYLSKDDLEKLEKGFMAELKAETKKGLLLRPSDEITGGLAISYDAGRSYYDFTDKAIAEYISRYLRPRLAEILQGA